jgi:hypothetical protein
MAATESSKTHDELLEEIRQFIVIANGQKAPFVRIILKKIDVALGKKPCSCAEATACCAKFSFGLDTLTDGFYCEGNAPVEGKNRANWED